MKKQISGYLGDQREKNESDALNLSAIAPFVAKKNIPQISQIYRAMKNTSAVICVISRKRMNLMH